MYYSKNDKYDRVKFAGLWKDGDKDDIGEMEYKNGEKYVGNFKENIKIDKGVYRYSNGDIYMGGFVNGNQNGKGTYYLEESGNVEIGNYINNDTKGICVQLKENEEIITVKY